MKSFQTALQRTEPVRSLAPSEPTPTLVVADDDSVFREFEARILRDEGYRVLKATGAAEAMVLAHTTPTIHLLIAGFSRLELDGLDLMNRFRAVHPEVPVLIFIGSLPLLSHRTKKLKRFEVLGKPFDVKELLHKVRALLDAAAPLPIRRKL